MECVGGAVGAEELALAHGVGRTEGENPHAKYAALVLIMGHPALRPLRGTTPRSPLRTKRGCGGNGKQGNRGLKWGRYLEYQLTLNGGLANARWALKIVRYENVPKRCNEILGNVEKSGVSFEVHKDGRPYVRIEPVD